MRPSQLAASIISNKGDRDMRSIDKAIHAARLELEDARVSKNAGNTILFVSLAILGIYHWAYGFASPELWSGQHAILLVTIMMMTFGIFIERKAAGRKLAATKLLNCLMKEKLDGKS